MSDGRGIGWGDQGVDVHLVCGRVEAFAEGLQVFTRFFVGFAGIVAMNFVDIGAKTIFIADPVEDLEGRIAFEGFRGDAQGTGAPFGTPVTGLPFLHVNLQIAA